MAQENDVVLIYFEEQPAAFARIEEIVPDVKSEWFQVKLLLLQVPLQTVTWILRAAYIDGSPFTMGGRPVRMEAVVCPAPEAGGENRTGTDAGVESNQTEDTGKNRDAGKVVSLFDQKKNRRNGEA